MPDRPLFLAWTLWAAALALCGTGSGLVLAHPAPVDIDPDPARPLASAPPSAEGWRSAPLAPDQLASLRGGFDLSSGLRLSFGFERTISLNGTEISRTRLDLPDLARITPEQAAQANAALAQGALVQIGPGNLAEPGLTANVGSGTFIQNSLNDQHIQAQTLIAAQVNSLSLFKAINLQEALGQMLLDGASRR